MAIAIENPPIHSGLMFTNQILLLVSAPLLRDGPHGASSSLEPVQPLSVKEEIREILDAFNRPNLPIEFEVKVEIATTDTLHRILAADHRPLIIHFIGHGMRLEEDIALMLEDEVGKARPLDTNTLRTLLEPFSTPPCQLAVLNACHSEGLAEVLVEAGVPHVVAINSEDTILDIAARCFARYLYPALLNQRSISTAFYLARNAVLTDNTLMDFNDERTNQPVNWNEALKFRLLPENSIVHEESLSHEWAVGESVGPRWENTNIPSVSPDPFVGRRRDLYYIIGQLRQERCLVLHGMGGMGKTALALEAGRWQHERTRWANGVWFVALRNVTTTSQARERIAAAVPELSPDVVQSDSMLLEALDEKHTLLILDDVDVLLQADPDATADMLRSLLSCQWVKLIVTARYDLPGHVMYQSYPLARMNHREAQITFEKYAPEFKHWGVGDTYREDLHALLKFLDGYPFPIRLAATYMKKTRCSLHALRERLEAKPIDTLIYPGEREGRDTSLAATLDLSYHILPPGARDIFPLLALFPAGLSEDAASVILGKKSISALETLLQFSMAESYDEVAGIPRQFVLPEPARRYAEAHQQSHAKERYAPDALDFFCSFAKHVKELLVSKNDTQCRLLVARELPNLKEFLDWGYDYEQRADGICRSARATALLGSYWIFMNQYQIAITNLNRAVEAARRNNDRIGEANVQEVMGDIYWLEATALRECVDATENPKQSRREQESALISYGKKRGAALAGYEEALALYRALEQHMEAARVQTTIGNIHRLETERLYKIIGDAQQSRQERDAALGGSRRERDAALASYKQASELYKSIDAQLDQAHVQRAIGDMYRSEFIQLQKAGFRLRPREERDAALASYQQASELYKSIDTRDTQLDQAHVERAIGDMYRLYKEWGTALASYQQASELYQSVNAQLDQAHVQRAISDCQLDIALASYEKTLTLYEEIADLREAAQEASYVQRIISDIKGSRSSRGDSSSV